MSRSREHRPDAELTSGKIADSRNPHKLVEGLYGAWVAVLGDHGEKMRQVFWRRQRLGRSCRFIDGGSIINR